MYIGLGSFALILLLTWAFYKDEYKDFFKF